MERKSSYNKLLKDPQYHGIRYRESPRVIGKAGDHNIELTNIPNKMTNAWRDIITTLIDGQWRFTFTIFAMSYMIVWFIFAVLYYWASWDHGDFEIDPITNERFNKDVDPCIYNTEGFSGFFLMSMESQSSLGYGTYYPSEECKDTIAILVIQVIVGVCIEGAIIGAVWTKMSRPPKRMLDQKFSKRGVICTREGKLCLVFRVDDPGRNHDIGTKVEAYWMGEKITEEGEQISKYQQSLQLENDGQVTLLWPQTISHVIDSKSPLYELSAKDIKEKKFEIILTITGNSSRFGQLSQSRTSYLSNEILWGHRFRNIITLDPAKGSYIADYSSFDKSDQVTTALCSAKQLDEVLNDTKKSVQTYVTNEYFLQSNMSDYEIDNNNVHTIEDYDDAPVE